MSAVKVMVGGVWTDIGGTIPTYSWWPEMFTSVAGNPSDLVMFPFEPGANTAGSTFTTAGNVCTFVIKIFNGGSVASGTVPGNGYYLIGLPLVSTDADTTMIGTGNLTANDNTVNPCEIHVGQTGRIAWIWFTSAAQIWHTSFGINKCFGKRSSIQVSGSYHF